MACKCKINNAWTAVIKFFKKTNGQWENVLSAWKKRITEYGLKTVI